MSQVPTQVEVVAHKGQPNGYAALDSDGNVPEDQLGNVITSDPWFDPLDHGAVGDGETNDLPAIHQTMELAMEKGGTVLFGMPPVAYGISDSIGSGSIGQVENIRLTGVGAYNAFPRIVSLSDADVVAGSFVQCEWDHLILDGANLGGRGMSGHVDHNKISLRVINWGTAGLDLNNDSDSQGYLNRVRDCDIVIGSRNDASYGMRFGDRFTDSIVEMSYIEGQLADIMWDGSAVRILDNHLNGLSDRNIILNGVSYAQICRNNCEHPVREFLLIDMPTSVTEDTELDLIVADNFFPDGSRVTGGRFPAITIRSLGQFAKYRKVTINGNVVGVTGAFSTGPEFCVDLIGVGNVSLVGNAWANAHTDTDPVRVIGGDSPTTVEVLGNGGDNNVAGAPSGPAAPEFPIAAWYEADTQMGSNGSAVTTWADQSPNSNNLTTGSSTKPTVVTAGPNSHKAVASTGAGEYLSATDTSSLDMSGGLSVHLVIKPTLGTNNFLVSKGSSYPSQYLVGTTTDGKVEFRSDNFQDFADAGVLTANVWQVVSAYFDGEITDFRINGKNGGAINARPGTLPTDSGPLTILNSGAQNTGDSFVGQVAEIIVMEGPVSYGTRAALDAYLMTKYAVTAA